MDSIGVGVTTMFKAANSRGMSYHVFIVYAYGLAALLLLPAPFFTHKSRALPHLSLPIAAKLGLLGLVGYVQFKKLRVFQDVRPCIYHWRRPHQGMPVIGYVSDPTPPNVWAVALASREGSQFLEL
ncbi:WAT1-related protein At3g28050, partial [Eucalyptus grandis]|uniref:WAT1-related protein At3g28050 n=1 Tax=Eucalyptus grandis TaxID=71139 RepID=UPI00192EF5DC